MEGKGARRRTRKEFGDDFIVDFPRKRDGKKRRLEEKEKEREVTQEAVTEPAPPARKRGRPKKQQSSAPPPQSIPGTKDDFSLEFALARIEEKREKKVRN